MTRDDIVAAARALAAREGVRALGCAAFCRDTGIERRRILQEFGTWAALCEAAGLETAGWQKRVPEDEIFAAMRDAFLADGGITTRARFQRGFRYSPRVITARFRTWHAALTAFRAWAAAHDPGFPLMDRLDARLAEGDTAPPAPAPVVPRAWPSTGRPPSGEVVGVRGFLHGPVNEAGVAVMFGALAYDLGCLIEAIHAAFPDCRAKRRTGSGQWEPVLIEFEFKSRTFRDHGHDPAGCDIVVCWEHNWPGCPVEVVELRAALAELGLGVGDGE